MTPDELRDRIATELHRWMGGDRDYYDAPAAAVMAEVREAVAAELDAAADDDDQQRNADGSCNVCGSYEPSHRHGPTLRDRADRWRADQ